MVPLRHWKCCFYVAFPSLCLVPLLLWISLVNYKIQFSWRTCTMACSSERPAKKNQTHSSHGIEWLTIFFWTWSRSSPTGEPSAFPFSPPNISTQLSSPSITEHLSLKTVTLRCVRAAIKEVSTRKFWPSSSSCCEMQASSWAANSGKQLWLWGGGHLRFGIIWMLLGGS